MRSVQQQFRAVSDRVARREVPGYALLGGPLLVLLLVAARAPAEESGMQSLFDGVRRGTATPEVAQERSFDGRSHRDRDVAQAAYLRDDNALVLPAAA